MMDKRKRVLLVERDNVLCYCIRNILKKDIYDVDFAYDAREALTKIQNTITDLVLFDCDSLGLKISEFISLMRVSAGNIPGIVAMINSTDGFRYPDYARLAVDDVITKPLNSTELQYRIYRILEQKSGVRLFDTNKSDSETFLEMLKAASSTQSSKEILHTIVKKIAILMDATRCSVFRVACTEKFARLIASHDTPDIHSEIMIDNYPEIKKALEIKDTVIVRSIFHDPLMKGAQEQIKSLKDNTIIVIPIILKENVIGILFLRSIREDKFFNESTLKFLKAMAYIVANVLDNAFLYENLESTRLQLTQSERLRTVGEVATGVVHNFNNVLSGILGHIQMLLSWDVDAAMCERLQTIEKLVLDGSDVVKRVQEFTGICTSKDFTTININTIVNDVVRMTEPKWSGGPNNAGIALRVDIDSTETPVVEGIASELREVFTNILFNAVDAMPNGGKLTIQTRTNREDVSVCFFDTGEGMSKETKKRVFDPFFTTKGSRGMGLGMSVAYEIIKRHNGQIIIDSELGVGTAVTVQFPMSKKLMRKTENTSHLKKGGKTKILLLGNNAVTTEVLAGNFVN